MSVQYKNSRKFNRVTQNDIIDSLETIYGIGTDTATEVVELVDAREYSDLLTDENTSLKGCVKRELLTSQINSESVLAVVMYQHQKNEAESDEVILYKKGGQK